MYFARHPIEKEKNETEVAWNQEMATFGAQIKNRLTSLVDNGRTGRAVTLPMTLFSNTDGCDNNNNKNKKKENKAARPKNFLSRNVP